MKIKNLTTLAVTVLLVSACADGNHRPAVFDQNFGLATRSMMQAQIANPHAAEHPSPYPPRRMDGYAGGNSLRGYREGFGQIDVTQPVIVNIGSASGEGTGQ